MAATRTVNLPLLEEKSAELRESSDCRLSSLPKACSDQELAAFVTVASRATACEPTKVKEGTLAGEYAITLQIAEQESAGAIVSLLEHKYTTDPRFREFMTSRVSGQIDREHFERELKARFREFFTSKWKAKPFDAAFLNEIDPATQKLLFRSCGVIQLTDGCSIACSFCGVNAPKGVRLYFSYDDLKRIVVTHAHEFLARNHTFFYWASDPFDWKGNPEWAPSTLKYPDIHQLVRFWGDYEPFVSTAVPKGEEATVRQHSSIVGRISVSFMNEARLRKAWPDVNLHSESFYKVEINTDLNEKTRGKQGIPGAERGEPSTIGCIDGTLLTPRGFFNVVQFLRITERYREGQTTVQIVPERLSEPLPDTPIAIEELLQRAVARYEYFGRWDRSRHAPVLNTRCVEFHNLTESRTYAFDAENGMAIPVSDRERKLYTLLTKGVPGFFASDASYAANVRDLLSLVELEGEEVSPVLFNQQWASWMLQRIAMENVGTTLIEWANRFNFLSRSGLTSGDVKMNGSIAEHCAVLPETVRVLRESKTFAAEPLFAEFSDKQIAAGLLLYWLADANWDYYLSRWYSDSPETSQRLQDEAAAVDGAKAVAAALAGQPPSSN